MIIESAEELNALPEKMRGEFVEVEINGKKVWQDKDANELRGHLFNVKEEMRGVKEKVISYEKERSESEQKIAKRIEEERNKAMEEARSKGDVAAIEERYKQQMADLEKRTAERVRKEVEGEFKGKEAEQRQKSLAKELGLQYGVDKDAAETIRELLEKRIQIDADSGREIYLDENGGATSLDRAGFEKEFFNSPRVIRLVKADVATTGGGMANGNNGKGGASNVNAKAEEAKKNGDLTGFLKANIST